MNLDDLEQLIGKISVAGTAIFGAWKGYQKFIKPAYSWCRNQLGLVKRVNSMDNSIHTNDLKIDTLIKLSPFPIFMAEPDTGNIIYVNAAWTEIFDLNLEESQNWYKRVIEPDRIRYAWQELLSKKILFDERFIITANNKQTQVRCKAVVQKNKNNKYLKILGIIVEI